MPIHNFDIVSFDDRFTWDEYEVSGFKYDSLIYNK